MALSVPAAAAAAAPAVPPRDPLEPSKVFVPWNEPDYELILRVQKKVLVDHNTTIYAKRKASGMLEPPVSPLRAGDEAAAALDTPAFDGDTSAASQQHTPSASLAAKDGVQDGAVGAALVTIATSTNSTSAVAAAPAASSSAVPTTFMCNVLIEDALRQALAMIRGYRQSASGGALSELAKDLVEQLRREVQHA